MTATKSPASSSTKLPKIALDMENEDLLRSLLEALFLLLPETLRSKAVSLSASEVLMEAVEYLHFLKTPSKVNQTTNENKPNSLLKPKPTILAPKHANTQFRQIEPKPSYLDSARAHLSKQLNQQSSNINTTSISSTRSFTAQPIQFINTPASQTFSLKSSNMFPTIILSPQTSQNIFQKTSNKNITTVVSSNVSTSSSDQFTKNQPIFTLPPRNVISHDSPSVRTPKTATKIGRAVLLEKERERELLPPSPLPTILRYVTNDTNVPQKIVVPPGAKLVPLNPSGVPSILLDGDRASLGRIVELIPGATIPVTKIMNHEQEETEKESPSENDETSKATSSSEASAAESSSRSKKSLLKPRSKPVPTTSSSSYRVNLPRRESQDSDSCSSVRTATFDPRHGLICQYNCKCPLSQDDIDLPEEYKQLLFAYVRSRMARKKHTEVETFLTLKHIQDEIIDKLIHSLTRNDMHKFLRLLSQQFEKVRAQEGYCLPYEPRRNKVNFIRGGKIELHGNEYSIHLLLFKLFRRDCEGTELKELKLTSKKICSTSKSYSGRVCLNPWHFERADPALETLIASPDHKCETRLRITYEDFFYLCPFCQQHRCNFDASAANNDESLKTNINGSPSKVNDTSCEPDTSIVKIEIDTDELNKKEEAPKDEHEKFIDDLEEDFEASLGVLEKEVMRAETEIEHGNNESNVQNVGQKRKTRDQIQCRHCEGLFNEESVKSHSCYLKVKGTFCCPNCGMCFSELSAIENHQIICKASDIIPIIDQLSKKKNENDSGSRSKRAKKSFDLENGDSRTCNDCHSVFFNRSELYIHMEKNKCKSIYCTKCNFSFANERSYHQHECIGEVEDPTSNFHDDSKDLSELDQEERFIKCRDCRGLLLSETILKRHLSGPISCPKCFQKMNSQCDLFSHKCS